MYNYRQGENSYCGDYDMLFGGLVGGPVASLVDYYAPTQKHFWYLLFQNLLDLHVRLMIYYGRSRKK